MDSSVLQQLNFLDIVILIILFRICYIAVKTGLIIEFFKLLGLLFSIYIASHYYTSLSDMIQRHYIPKAIPLEFVDFVIFIILVSAGYLFFVLLRSVFYRFMKMEAVPKLNKYGGLVLGLARGYFTIGLLTYILMISSVSYLSSSVKRSYLGSRVSSVSAQTYNWIWESIFSKFSPQEKSNSIVSEVSDSFTKK
ncbi:MAG: CvpA family protein [Candidatus Omnitrophica bacterium]|nr:CvpA family protein [Candidatus Omnitrophota bacterium]MBU1923664.1 CvpA family protein [Candidatus Omnitrophota bacterium]